MKSLVVPKNCIMHEYHCGEYWQGCWEFNDICYMAIEEDMCKLGYRHTCSENDNVCPLRYKGGN